LPPAISRIVSRSVTVWRLWIWIASLILIASVAILGAVVLYLDRRGTTAAAAYSVQQSTRLLAVVIDQMIRDVDGLATGLELVLADRSPTEAVLDERVLGWLETRLGERPAVQRYALLDRHGVVRRMSPTAGLGQDLVAQPDVERPTDARERSTGSVVTEPYLSSAAGHRQLVVSWPLRRPDGSLVGVLVVGFATEIVERRFGRLAEDGAGVVALVDDEQMIFAIAGLADSRTMDGAHWDEGLTILLEGLGQRTDDAPIIGASTLFGVHADWLTDVQTLAMIDAKIIVARNLDRMLLRWRWQVVGALTGGSLLAVTLLLNAFALTRHLARQSHALVAATADARTDPLTGLCNRRLFDEHAAACLARCRENGRTFSIVLLDIDHFKAINDRHGHATGDAVLVAIAACLKAHVRRQDIVARIGVEEFAVLIKGLPAAGGQREAERLRHAVATLRLEIEGTELAVTVSLGVAGSGRCDQPIEAIIAAADAALYEAKRQGRNRSISADARTADIARLSSVRARATAPMAALQPLDPSTAEPSGAQPG
jgi:diguanylate cyclase (GGDEF)-like protein